VSIYHVGLFLQSAVAKMTTMKQFFAPLWEHDLSGYFFRYLLVVEVISV